MQATHAPGRATMLTLGAVTFAFAFQQFAVLPAIPTIEHSMHASTSWSAWLLSGYLMVATVSTPVLGRLGDLYGESTILLLSLAVFLLGSVGAATIPGLPALIVCRAAQGAGGAVFPLSFAIARRQLKGRQAVHAIGALTGTFGLGSTLGFAGGGWIAQVVSWRLIFGAGAVCVAIASVLVIVTVPRAGGTVKGKVDWPGALFLGATTLCVLLALTLGPQVGWSSPVPALLLAVAAVAGMLWVRTELHHDEPLIDLRVLRDRIVLWVNGATVALGWGRFASLLLLPLLLTARGGHVGFAEDATVTGLIMVPSGIGVAVGGPLASSLSRHVRPGLAMAAGLALIASSGVLIAAGLGSIGIVIVAITLSGLGSGIATQASGVVTTNLVPAGTAGASSALNAATRRFSGGVGGQLSIVFLTLGAASGGGQAARSVLTSAAGYQIAFAFTAALALGAAVLALLADRAPAGSFAGGGSLTGR